jgi:hypothetical protein
VMSHESAFYFYYTYRLAIFHGPFIFRLGAGSSWHSFLLFVSLSS